MERDTFAPIRSHTSLRTFGLQLRPRVPVVRLSRLVRAEDDFNSVLLPFRFKRYVGTEEAGEKQSKDEKRWGEGTKKESNTKDNIEIETGERGIEE